MDIELQRIVLKRIFRASADYYLMKETGECRGVGKDEIKDEMAAALVDARLTCDPEELKEVVVAFSGEVSGSWGVGGPVKPGSFQKLGPGEAMLGLQKLQKASTRAKESFFSKMLKGAFTYGKKSA